MRLSQFKNHLRLMCGGSCLLAAAVASATTYYVDDSVSSSGNGDSWPTAKKTFKDLYDTITLQPGDVVKVGQGQYKPSSSGASFVVELKIGVSIQGGWAGHGAQDPDVYDPDTFITTITGDYSGNDGDFLNYSDNAHHVIRADDGVTPPGSAPYIGPEEANLDGFTIRSGSGGSGSGGGGIYITGSSPVIRHCKIKLCKAVAGGGIYADNASNAVIRECEITDNLATDNVGATGGGGGMFVYGPCALLHCSIDDNESQGSGGGLRTFSANNTHVRIVSCSISNNQAVTLGGGLSAAGGSTTGSRLSLTNCLIVKNVVADDGLSEGGGVRSGDVSVTIDHCTLADNFADGSGGGWFFWRGSGDAAPVMRNSICWSNTASAGYNIWANSGGHTVVYSTVGEGDGQPAGTVSNNSSEDPDFVNPAGGNYQLACGTPISPAINTGDTTLARVDTDDVDEDGNTTELAVDRLLQVRAVNAVDRGALEKPVGSGCDPADIFPAPCGDANINIDDLLEIINGWGTCPAAAACYGNVPSTQSGVVNIDDLLAVINAWGTCSQAASMPQSISECMSWASSECAESEDPDCWSTLTDSCLLSLCARQIIECD